MSPNGFIGWRLLYGALFAIAVYIVTYQREEREEVKEAIPKKQRYIPFVNSYLIMVFLVMLPMINLLFGYSPAESFHFMFSVCFSILAHICLFYPVLLAVLPLLRKRISARVCAALWQIPNFLYLILTHDRMTPNRPLWILKLPVQLVQAAIVVWLTGFLAVFGWKIIDHLRFRKTVLAGAQEVSDPALLALWEAEQQAAGFGKHRYRLVVSPAAATPLTIGFWTRSIRVILPDKDYTPEELALVLRHEIVHLGRMDSGSKLFLTFCTALCWFNPLMWIAMRRSAEDLELSCDEAVLREADASKRALYAELLLTTAGDDRGFSSNLSNSAKALRYRLRQVIHPVEKTAGATTIALTTALLLMTCGFISVTYAAETGENAIFRSADLQNCTVRSVYWNEEYEYLGQSTVEHGHPVITEYECSDPPALMQYFSGLRLHKITGQYTFHSDTENILRLVLETPVSTVFVYLDERMISVQTLADGRLNVYGYVPEEPLDWEFIQSKLIQINHAWSFG